MDLNNKKDWYKKAVGYQIYPKSFNDSNGDGIGDIKGIIKKLPYLQELGIDFVWLNPIYTSPQVDGGYDISDFYSIDPIFGTLDDFKSLIINAHEIGIKVIMDLVINHTSDKHPWFIQSRSSRNNKYRDYYLWEDSEPDKFPNNWKSFFGNSTWSYDDKTRQSYFHVFTPNQPDLNWENPDVRSEIYKMIRWWLDLGIDGFRLDAISHLKKKTWDFEIRNDFGQARWEPFTNVEGLEVFIKELKLVFEEYGALTVGEASGVNSFEGKKWTGDNGYFNMIFELEHNTRFENGLGDIFRYKKIIMRWQQDLLDGGWGALYIENHDLPRSISIFGDDSIECAKAFAASYMLLRGTPFIYQGQEIGMSNFPITNISQVTSPDTLVHYQKAIIRGMTLEDAFNKTIKNSRDVSRSPMQWNLNVNSGFTNHIPWFPVNPNYEFINTKGENSKKILDFYKSLIKLRQEEKAFSEGNIEFLFKNHTQVLSFIREEYLIVVNLTNTPASINFRIPILEYDVVLSSHFEKLHRKMKLDAWDYLIFKKKNIVRKDICSSYYKY